MDMIESEVNTAYRWILGREADPQGLADYARLIRAGDLDAEGLRDILLSSGEFQQNRAGRVVQDRQAINDLVIGATEKFVQAGPFAGMRMVDMSTRGDGDIAPKLLGTYEQELHPYLEQFAARRYDAVIDIGCAEGYYTVGAAKLFPDTPILAYDVDPGALEILRAMAIENDCLARIIMGDFCDLGTLRGLYEKYPRSFIIADCEGYEKILFCDPATNSVSAYSDLIIECHDLWDAEITPAIMRALESTHHITVARASGRDPNAFPFLAGLDDWDRWRSIWERRGALQHWLICEGKGATA